MEVAAIADTVASLQTSIASTEHTLRTLQHLRDVNVQRLQALCPHTTVVRDVDSALLVHVHAVQEGRH